ncbi:SDR family oxidoreductase [Celerinatantimonas sp. YJH-8]|uniref:SDR family oxidoreductase n=1 Tax=Celerinatantimonas sp. YJH-8 TaxID=3228714 RepID=UPI0038C8DECE
MDLGLQNKRALVLASSQGLGLGIAKTLAAEGAQVILTGRSPELSTLALQLDATFPGQVLACPLDLAQPDCVATLSTFVASQFGQLDILINNCGGPPVGDITSITTEQWLQQFQMMVLRIIEITNTFLPAMRAQKWGRILTVSSISVEQPIDNLGLSNTLRSALVGWSKTLANEVAADGITCNLLLPGRIQTSRVEQLDQTRAQQQNRPLEAIQQQALSHIPMHRYGQVEEFAATAAFLVSELASYITGSKIRCDGGAIRTV